MGQSMIHKFSGSSLEVGLSIGQSLGERFNKNANRMIRILDELYGLDFEKLRSESMEWLTNLPVEYQRELEGVAAGSGCALEEIAQWYYSGMCIDGGCTSFIIKQDDYCWVGRNNDYLLPGAWRHVNIIKVNGRIPVMLFGLEGDIFSGTGFNREKIWIHYNWLPIWDEVSSLNSGVIPPYVFIRKALESCHSIKEVETLLQCTIRDGGMNLFVVDGKTNDYAVFECTSCNYQTREEDKIFIAGANHYCTVNVPAGVQFDFKKSIKRQSRVEEILRNKINRLSVDEMIDILSDSEVEQTDRYSGTVYSNLACPGRELIWFACDSFPAASKSSWEKVEWNW